MEKARGRTLGAGRIDRAKVEATTEHDTRRHMMEDGLNPDNPLAGFRPLSGVAEVRHRAEMSQDAFAEAIQVPVKTIRNWEQGRSRPDPAAQALLAIVSDDPSHAFQAIKRNMKLISAFGDRDRLPVYYQKVRKKTKTHESQALKDTVKKSNEVTATTSDDMLKRM